MNQPQHPKKRHAKAWIYALIGGMGWATGSILLIILSVSIWLPLLLEILNKKNSWWDHLIFSNAEFGLSSSQITNIDFKKDFVRLTSDGVIATYGFNHLIAGKAESITVLPTQIEIGILEFGQNRDPENNERSSSPALSSLLQPAPVLFFDNVSASRLQLSLTTDESVIPLVLDTNVDMQQTDSSLIVRAFAESDIMTCSFDCQFSNSDSADHQFNTSFEIGDLMTSIDRIRSFVPSIPEFNVINTFKTDKAFGAIEWSGSDNVLNSQILLTQITGEQLFELDTIYFANDLTINENSSRGNLSIDQISLPGGISTAASAVFEVNGVFSEIPRVDSIWTLQKININSEPLFEEIELHLGYENNSVFLYSPSISGTQIPPISEIKSRIDIDHSQNQDAVAKPQTQLRWAGSFELMPEFPQWDLDLKLSEKSTPWQFEFNGSNISTELANPRSLNTEAELRIPETTFLKTFPNSDTIQFTTSGDSAIQFDNGTASMQNEIQIPEVHFQLEDQFKFNAQANFSANSTWELPDSWTELGALSPHPSDFRSNLNISGSGHFGEIPLAIKNLELAFETPTSEKYPFQADANLIQWDRWELAAANAKGFLYADGLDVFTAGELINSSISVEGDYSINWKTGEQTGDFIAKTQETLPVSRVELKTLFPELPPIIISAIFKALFSFEIQQDAFHSNLNLSIQAGEVLFPDQGTSVNGIQIPKLMIADLATGETIGYQTVEIETIHYPPVEISDLKCEFEIDSGYIIQIKSLEFRFCEGTFEIQFHSPIQYPYSTFEFEVEFRNLDLYQLTQFIPEFKEEIRGKIDGYLPLALTKSGLSWNEGSVYLSPETTAQLKYAEDGLLASYIPEIELAKDLDIDINDALRDITITELNLNIQPSRDFENPSVLILSGYSNHSKIEIPIERIQINIRAGDIPEFINESFNLSKWIESVLLK